ncbi:CaiB/BaiF CoA transferase family protein [Marinobacter sp. X15-166B]|uniref:CaiB/BaiF CoA transferase family protein n=1 Tax=Marinobacter sp. X15-166B TaxID=1897620 RepID=UPI00085C9CDA|nr:CaiB/BaiF CoA-transferase family protein [Marinobacter sp. X15-166B]OEY65980.1 carnitine dehydratase [Marinobacter sp. X15-166B]
MSLPLAGLKVLDFSTLLPGPYATQLLADMGAEVLRVESPARPDLLKVMPPMAGPVSAAHATLNRNKKSIAIDLKHASAKSIIEGLLLEYDVVIEQFRPGVMARLGLDYQQLSNIQNRLIYCSITGYGQTGPYKDRAGHDINYLALSGLASYSGRKETGPVLSGTQIADIAGGSHHAVMAILAAVIQRGTTGRGQYLDISMSDAALALNTIFGAGALVSEQDPTCGGEMLNGGWYYDYYETADGRYLSVGSLEPGFAAGLLNQLGLRSFMNNLTDARPEAQGALRDAIAEKINAQPLAHWQAVFAGLDVCVEPVLTLNEAASHDHFVARGMITSATDTDGNAIKQINSALPFRKQSHQAGVGLGDDTTAVLAGLGYSSEAIAALREARCVK